MTEEALDSVVQVELEPKVGPGCNLREAREARNLTLEAVAKQLHIDIVLVRALEDDDYSRFAAPIFVTGNLRAYARLLGLTPEPLIEAYQNLGTAAPPPLERVAYLNHQPEPVSTAQVPRWLVYVLVVAVVAVVILIWRSEAAKLLAPLMESPLMSGMSLHGVPNNDGTSPLPAQVNGEAPQQLLQLPAFADEKTDQSVPEAPAASGTAQPQAQPQAQSQARSDLPRAKLALKAEKPSWVEVKDGAGNRLFYDLMAPGDAQSIEGVPPFDILLGYAPGIIVEYNGKRVDYSAYAHQDMARFRVGDKGASQN